MNRRQLIASVLGLPFAKPALKAIMAPVRAVSSRYALYRAMRLQKERQLWTASFNHLEAQLWAEPDETEGSWASQCEALGPIDTQQLTYRFTE